jgi:hypothetical protein
MFSPSKIPVFYSGNRIIKLRSLTENAGVKTTSFLTGFTQIALTRQGSIHLLSMALNLSDYVRWHS